jgi:long-chain acyl-CoA synthetase
MTTTEARDTLPARFLANVAARPDAVALRARHADGSYREWTYRDYAGAVARCAAGLRARGFGPGQRLVMMLRNRPEFHVLDMAVYFCGGTAVSIYNSSSAEQIAYLLGHSRATIAVADDAGFLARFLEARARLPHLRTLCLLDGAPPDGVLGWEALLDHAPLDLEAASHAAEPSGLCTLIYTSGTTGPPKAVMLTHHNVVWTLDTVERMLAPHPRFARGFAGVRVLSYLPMAHVAERVWSHYWPALGGQVVTCCPDASKLALYLREVRPEMMFGVPRVWEKLHAAVQAAAEQDPARVRAMLGLDATLIALTGAAPISRELEQWFRAIGVPLTSIYGLSETSGPMTWSPFDGKPGRVGAALPGTEVKLAEDGEVLCRGQNLFAGYLDAAEQTAAALDADGWLHTGDIGTLDADGQLSVVDRKKELIITAGGKNVSPANLEAALKTVPLVAQACAIGDGRPYVSALLVLDPDAAAAWAERHGAGAATLRDLSRHPALVAEVERGVERVMQRFNRAEQVKRVAILGTDWLPDSEELTPTSKLKRRAILAKYHAEIDALYASASETSEA